jgi:hypothetical protein
MSTESTELTTQADAIVELEEVAKECRRELANVESQFGPAFAIAKLTKRLDQLITDEMMDDVMALCGHPLGFRTDLDDKPNPYPVEVVRPAFIEATIRGFRAVNNEFNIIAKRFYGCKPGFQRLVLTFPELTNFEDAMAVPEKQAGRALVAYVASWCLAGEEMHYERSKKRLPSGGEFDNRIVVRVNEGMGDDAILGKATRKAYAGIYDLITGHTVPIPEGDVADAIDVPSRKPARKSTLFDDAPPEATGPNEAEQDALIVDYDKEIGEVTAPREIGLIAKKAGGDERLTVDSRKEIMEVCKNKRQKLSGAVAKSAT